MEARKTGNSGNEDIAEDGKGLRVVRGVGTLATTLVGLGVKTNGGFVWSPVLSSEAADHSKLWAEFQGSGDRRDAHQEEILHEHSPRGRQSDESEKERCRLIWVQVGRATDAAKENHFSSHGVQRDRPMDFAFGHDPGALLNTTNTPPLGS